MFVLPTFPYHTFLITRTKYRTAHSPRGFTLIYQNQRMQSTKKYCYIHQWLIQDVEVRWLFSWALCVLENFLFMKCVESTVLIWEKKKLFFQLAEQKQRGHYLASGRYTHTLLCNTMTAIGNLKVWHIIVLILLKLIALVKFSCT